METEPDHPVTVVGMLWFDPDGGEETFRNYLEASRPFMEKHLGRPFVSQTYRPVATLGGDLDPDLVAINEFHSKAAFMAAIEDPEYPSHLLEGAVTRVEVVQVRKD